MNKFYITTAIDYPNADPHLGHAYEKIVADVFARWHRLKGEKVFYSYGLDEHGQKISAVAESKNLSPKKFVDQQHLIFKNFMKSINVSNDSLIRTSDEKHEKFCQKMFQKVLDKGEIYKGEYKGNYCIYEETFYTDLQLENGNCPECGRPTKVVSEEAYFFKLNEYKDRLVQHIEKNPNFIKPESRKNEVLSRLKGDKLRDLCVSRSSFSWGIPLPNDKEHIIYVWFDALLNYLSIIDYPSDFWPSDVQVIGKDILWFHTVIWPSMLMAMDIPLPKTVYAHGFINDAHGEAMSKSKGNVVDPVELVDLYGVDALRFYLLRTVPSGEDGNFSEKELIAKYNGELGNDLGNLVKRVEVLALKFFDGVLENKNFKDEIKIIEILKQSDELMSDLQYHKALELIWSNLKKINVYLNEKEPWKNKTNRKQVIYNTLENLRIVTHLLRSFIPESAQHIAEHLDFKFVNFADLKFGFNKYVLTEQKILFPKVEVEDLKIFPLDLKVAKVLEAKRVPDDDMLYVLQLSLGKRKAQTVTGMVSYYSEEEIVGKHLVVVANMKSAKLRGFESEVMVLAASKGDKVKLLEVPLSSAGAEITVEGFQNDSGQLSLERFKKIKLEVKYKQVWYNNKVLKTDKEDVQVDIGDGAIIS